MSRRAIIAVVGGGQGLAPRGSPAYVLAEAVGRCIAERGGILLCGGGTGVMEAAARGAYAVRPRTIGIMKEAQGAPKSHLGLMVWTGLGDGRNYVNAAAADALIALAGEAGTLSEIALGLKLGKPVVCLQAWEFLARAGFRVQCCATPEEAVALAFQVVRADSTGFVEAAVIYPTLPDQAARQHEFAAAVAAWSNDRPCWPK